MHTWCMFKIRLYDNIKNKKNSFSQFKQHVIKQTFEIRTNWIYCGQLRGLQSSNGHKTNIHMLIIIKWELHATHHRQHEELFKVPLIQPRRLGNSNRYSTVITEVRLSYLKQLMYYIFAVKLCVMLVMFWFPQLVSILVKSYRIIFGFRAFL